MDRSVASGALLDELVELDGSGVGTVADSDEDGDVVGMSRVLVLGVSPVQAPAVSASTATAGTTPDNPSLPPNTPPSLPDPRPIEG
jgi:hypothetical protein